MTTRPLHRRIKQLWQVHGELMLGEFNYGESMGHQVQLHHHSYHDYIINHYIMMIAND
jgi:hypothetical protein